MSPHSARRHRKVRGGIRVFLAPVATAGLLGTVMIPTPAAAYVCDVHIPRDIYDDETDTSPRSTHSLRDECFEVVPAFDTLPAHSEFETAVPSEWVICLDHGTDKVVSDRSAKPSSCDTSQTELGKCVHAVRYYTKKEVGQPADFEGEVGYSFVPNPAVCEPCAHDVASAVLGCKAMCNRLLHGRYYDKDVDLQHNNGSWVLMTQEELIDGPSALPSHVNKVLFDPDVATDQGVMGNWESGGVLDDHIYVIEDTSPTDLVTPAEWCRRRCGPPNHLDSETASEWNALNNHWRFVTFGRWNPNVGLDGWLRSYTVNKDKPDAPRKECKELVNGYCEDLDGTTVGNRNQCKKRLALRRLHMDNPPPAPTPFPPTLVDYSGDTHDFTTLVSARYPDNCNDENFSEPEADGETNIDKCDCDDDPLDDPECQPNTTRDLFKDNNFQNDSFCDILFRGNYMCPKSCYRLGDGGHNPFHKCCHGTKEGENGDYCSAGGILRDDISASAKCETLPLEREDAPGGEYKLRTGGAVCETPMTFTMDGTDEVSDYNDVEITRSDITGSGGCTATDSCFEVTYTRPNGDEAPDAHVAKAVWLNETTSGDTGFGANDLWSGELFYNGGSNKWEADIPLEEGETNRIRVTFTDRMMRTSGDVVDLVVP